MDSIKLFKLISILAVATGNLITLDGKCPFSGLTPDILAIVPLLRGKFNVIAETSLGGINRTDISMTLKQTASDKVTITNRFRSKESGQCDEFYINIEAFGRPGVYEAAYQVAPETNFAEYKAYFLAMDLIRFKAIAFICHDLPNSQYQVEIAVLSAFTNEFDKATQAEVQNFLEYNNIGYLNKYLVEIEQNHKCDFSTPEIIDSLIPLILPRL